MEDGSTAPLIRRAVPADWPVLEAIHPRARDWAEYDVWVIEFDSRAAGFLAVRQIAVEEYEILEVAVAAALRRRGLATAMLQHRLREAPGTYFLEVRESNHNARSLYSGLGFKEAGRRASYYSEPDEAAIVMSILS